MKKGIVLLLLLSVTACTSLAPPKPPCCNNKAEGMRPINPDVISQEQVSAWEQQKEEEKLAALKAQENIHGWK